MINKIGLLFFCSLNIIFSNQELLVYPMTIPFREVDSYDLNHGFIDTEISFSAIPSSLEINLEDNQKWSLYIFSENQFLLPYQLEKPISDIMWKLKSQPINHYKELSQNKVLILSGIGKKDIKIDLKIKLDWNDFPANYQLETIFELEKKGERIKEKKIHQQKYIPK